MVHLIKKPLSQSDYLATDEEVEETRARFQRCQLPDGQRWTNSIDVCASQPSDHFSSDSPSRRKTELAVKRRSGVSNSGGISAIYVSIRNTTWLKSTSIAAVIIGVGPPRRRSTSTHSRDPSPTVSSCLSYSTSFSQLFASKRLLGTRTSVLLR